MIGILNLDRLVTRILNRIDTWSLDRAFKLYPKRIRWNQIISVLRLGWNKSDI